MPVTIRLFAVYRDLLGKSEITLAVDGPRTVSDLYQQVLGGRAEADLQKATLFAVNETYVPSDTIIKDGDRVAFIPPVSGG